MAKNYFLWRLTARIVFIKNRKSFYGVPTMSQLNHLKLCSVGVYNFLDCHLSIIRFENGTSVKNSSYNVVFHFSVKMTHDETAIFELSDTNNSLIRQVRKSLVSVIHPNLDISDMAGSL